ncbi:MAG: hypothetical protein WAL12_08655 [Trebonia sp.]
MTVLANGAPVVSRSGSASSSQRSSTVGPLPLASTPVTPVPPMPSWTVKPSPRSRPATRRAVWCSWWDSSGCWCRSR